MFFGGFSTFGVNVCHTEVLAALVARAAFALAAATAGAAASAAAVARSSAGPRKVFQQVKATGKEQ